MTNEKLITLARFLAFERSVDDLAISSRTQFDPEMFPVRVYGSDNNEYVLIKVVGLEGDLFMLEYNTLENTAIFSEFMKWGKNDYFNDKKIENKLKGIINA